MKPLFTCLLAAWALLTAFPALGRDGDQTLWQLELRPGYSWISDDNDEMEGFSIAAMGGYRVYDSLLGKLDLEYSSFDAYDFGRAQFVETALGLNYDIDFSPVVPTIGSGIGTLFRKKRGEAWSTDLSWHVLGGVHYFVTETVGLGAEAKYHLLLSDLNQNPIYFTLAAKVVLAF